MPRTSADCARRRQRRRTGNVAMMTALMLTLMLGFAALAVDVSNKYRVRTESQSAVDAAALAGARELRGTAQAITTAQAQARVIGEQHYAYQANVKVPDSDIMVGRWDANLHDVVAATPALSNAVKVTHTEPAVAHPFASALTGTTASTVAAHAVALGGGPGVAACGFPLALASCTLEGGAGGNNCGGCMKMASAPQDNVGWANFDGNTSVPAVSDALKAACFAADGKTPLLDANGRCLGSCAKQPKAGVDEMQLGNGNNFTKNPDQFCEMLKSLLRASPTRTVRVQLPVFQSGSAGACNPQFSGHELAVGFAEVEFLGAKCNKNDPDPVDPGYIPAGCDKAKADHYMIAQIMCGTTMDAPGGGGYFGVAARPVLID